MKINNLIVKNNILLTNNSGHKLNDIKSITIDMTFYQRIEVKILPLLITYSQENTKEITNICVLYKDVETDECFEVLENQEIKNCKCEVFYDSMNNIINIIYNDFSFIDQILERDNYTTINELNHYNVNISYSDEKINNFELKTIFSQLFLPKNVDIDDTISDIIYAILAGEDWNAEKVKVQSEDTLFSEIEIKTGEPRGGGSSRMRFARNVLYSFAKACFFLTTGKLILSSSMLVIARK